MASVQTTGKPSDNATDDVGDENVITGFAGRLTEKGEDGEKYRSRDDETRLVTVSCRLSFAFLPTKPGVYFLSRKYQLNIKNVVDARLHIKFQRDGIRIHR